MNLQAEKIEIAKMVLETENPSILNSIKDIFRKEGIVDFGDTLYNDRQEYFMYGIEDFENDETEDFDEFIKKYGR